MKINIKKIAIIAIIAYAAYAMLGSIVLVLTGTQPGPITTVIGYTLATGCVLGVIYFGWTAYMYPARVAKRNNHPHAEALWWVNLLFGVAIIPWLICLMIAGNGDKPNASLEGALKELDELKRKNLISDEEYAAKRNQILS